MTRFRPPTARPEIAVETLTRPDWRTSENRRPTKLWLDKNENVDPELAAVVRRALAEIPAEAHSTYPDTAALYAKLAISAGVESANLVLAAGSDGVIRAAFEAFVAVDDPVVMTHPTFAMYEVYARMYGAQPTTVEYEPSQAGPVISADSMIAAILTARPKLVCLPNPDSPTGTAFEASALQAIVEAAGTVGSLILIDEAYYPFHPETSAGWIGMYPHLLVARSTGKAWGMAGLRIGYGISSPEVMLALHKVRPMYEVNTVAAHVLFHMLDHADEMAASVARLNRGKQVFLSAMDGLGFRTLNGAGNFLHVAFGRHADAIHRALEDMVYYRKDFAHPSLAGFSRFSAATEAQFAPIIARIRQVVGEAA